MIALRRERQQNESRARKGGGPAALVHYLDASASHVPQVGKALPFRRASAASSRPQAFRLLLLLLLPQADVTVEANWQHRLSRTTSPRRGGGQPTAKPASLRRVASPGAFLIGSSPNRRPLPPPPPPAALPPPVKVVHPDGSVTFEQPPSPASPGSFAHRFLGSPQSPHRSVSSRPGGAVPYSRSPPLLGTLGGRSSLDSLPVGASTSLPDLPRFLLPVPSPTPQNPQTNTPVRVFCMSWCNLSVSAGGGGAQVHSARSSLADRTQVIDRSTMFRAAANADCHPNWSPKSPRAVGNAGRRYLLAAGGGGTGRAGPAPREVDGPVAPAVGETAILLHPTPPLEAVSIGMERERQQNDRLADG